MKSALLFTAMCMLSVAACTDDVAAPEGVEEPFSMYGILNPRLTHQTIMVSPIDARLTDYPDAIDAVVTSTDLETGERVTWRDSVVTGHRGQIDHVYTAEFLPPFGRDYRVVVTRSDGATTSAEVHIPDLVEATTETDAEWNLDILITGDAFHLLQLDVIYVMQLYRLHSPGCEGDSLFLSRGQFSHAFPYGGKESGFGNGYRVRLNLVFDHHRLDYLYNPHPGAFGLALTGMGVRLVVAEKAWSPPGGVFDANALADPGVMTNTINGFGLVAGGYNHEERVYPPREAIVRTRFLDGFIRPPRGDCTTYCECMGF